MIFLSLLGWTVLGPDGQPTQREIVATDVLSPSEIGGLTTHPKRLAKVATNAAKFIRDNPTDEACIGGIFTDFGVSQERTAQTLEFLAQVAKESPKKLEDPAFIKANFDVWKWTPDTLGLQKARLKTDQGLRLTKYLVYQSQGSPVRSEHYDTALYDSPDSPDFVGLTRMEVYAGAYDEGPAAGHAKPLVWMSREDVNRALMQGSVWVTMPDGKETLYNVNLNNGIAYQRSIKDSNQQARYWYFKAVDHVSGYGRTGDKVRLEPHVAVAGDVMNLGIGRVVAIHDGENTRVAVVADTGGAFSPNLFQLDWYAGPYRSHELFEKGVSHLPMYADAYVLVKKL